MGHRGIVQFLSSNRPRASGPRPADAAQIKRRDFVRSGLALGAATLWPPLAWTAEQLWDLIVVGAGTAGLPAAIFASRRGARVLLIDPADEVGGTLHRASGQISAAGCRFQAAQGIVDSSTLR